jgi:phosphoribosylformylglycinamidine cyclo-ligase
LARKLFFEIGNYPVDTQLIELGGHRVGETLLRPHRSYLPVLDGLLDEDVIKGLAHITGGGLLENIPRILPDGTSVELTRGTWTEPPVFGAMQLLGKVEDAEMFRTFNMGIGMTVICSRAGRLKIKEHCEKLGEKIYEIGTVVEGNGEVKII